MYSQQGVHTLTMENKLILIIVSTFIFLPELRQSTDERRYYDNNAEDTFLKDNYIDAEDNHVEDYYEEDNDVVDYFTEQFDGDKNCKDEKKLYNLIETHPDHCFSIKSDNEEHGIKSCGIGASRKLKKKCSNYAGVEFFGNITYCMARGKIDCCFNQPKCHKTLDKKYKHMDKCLCKYVKYGLDTMADFIAIKTQYKMCFKTGARETGPCEDACGQLREGLFAQNCSKEVHGKKGVFKCCIISRNIACDVCNYCCVLPICTRQRQQQVMNMTQQQLMNMTTATNEYDTEPTLFKTNLTNKPLPVQNTEEDSKIDYHDKDLFCVQPNLKKAKYRFYNMTEYRNATTLEEMKKLEKTTFLPFRGNSYDIYNPKDRLKFKKETGPRMEAKISGYDYCFRLQTNGKKTKCEKKCKKIKKQKFAKKCNKKKSSVFKCCINRIDLDRLETVQIRGLSVLNKTLTRNCGNGTCNYCCITAVCSTFHEAEDLEKAKVTTTFRTPQKTVLQTPRYRYSRCFSPTNKFNNSYWPIYNITEYKAAYTKDMLCRVTPRLDYDVSKKDRKKIPTKSKIKKKCDKIKEKRNKRKLNKKEYNKIKKKKMKEKKKHKKKKKERTRVKKKKNNESNKSKESKESKESNESNESTESN